MTALTEDKIDKIVFAPGCALMLYKPELAGKIHKILIEHFGEIDQLLTCCQHEPQLPENTMVINVCPGCNRRFGNDYPGISTITLWEVLAESDFFPFPDHHGLHVSIHDACPTREQVKVHQAIRKLLQKMNIVLVEPKHTKTKSICCGDSFYGLIEVENVKEQMVKRASEMPEDDVVVYCVSCIKSMHIGGKRPKYLADLLFDEDTFPKTFEPDDWHRELREYIELH
jgi:Fe-S oxidoreductase